MPLNWCKTQCDLVALQFLHQGARRGNESLDSIPIWLRILKIPGCTSVEEEGMLWAIVLVVEGARLFEIDTKDVFAVTYCAVGDAGSPDNEPTFVCELCADTAVEPCCAAIVLRLTALPVF